VASLFLAVLPVSAQTKYTAIDVPAGTVGNQSHQNWGMGGDFYVNNPVEIWELGVFDDAGDGIQSGATLTVQLYAKTGNRGVLLESLTFDAANPGRLQGGNRFKTLDNPVTLLPGAYSIVAYGFDPTNRAANATKEPYNNGQVPWTLNNGGGLITFVKGVMEQRHSMNYHTWKTKGVLTFLLRQASFIQRELFQRLLTLRIIQH